MFVCVCVDRRGREGRSPGCESYGQRRLPVKADLIQEGSRQAGTGSKLREQGRLQHEEHRGKIKLAEYKAAPAEATVASSHCGRNRMLAADLAARHPLGDLKCSLGDLKCCDAGLRPLRAGSPGLQRFNAESSGGGPPYHPRGAIASCGR